MKAFSRTATAPQMNKRRLNEIVFVTGSVVSGHTVVILPGKLDAWPDGARLDCGMDYQVAAAIVRAIRQELNNRRAK